jgi:hypothetical protein
MRRWPGVLVLADLATEPSGDVVDAVDVEDRLGQLVVVLGVRVWKHALHPLRVAALLLSAIVAVGTLALCSLAGLVASGNKLVDAGLSSLLVCGWLALVRPLIDFTDGGGDG